MIDPWMISTAAGLLTVGGAYGGTKVALNGTRERVKELKQDHAVLAEKVDHVRGEVTDRLARIETKLDALTK
jgi:predicted nuclease with TOPRIM domain